MNYFTVLGVAFGLAAALKPLYMHVLPWDEQAFIAKTYARERPRWLVPVAILGLGLVALTWYVHFTTAVPYSWVLALVFSLTALKGIVLLFDYQRFQAWVAGLLRKDRGRGVVLIDVATGIVGVAIIAFTLLVY